MIPRAGMVASAAVLGVVGICLLFAPLEVSRVLGIDGRQVEGILSLLAAAYLGFAMGNWAAKDSATGGIYQRPLCLANLAHFFIGAIYLIRAAAKAPSMAHLLGAAAYGVFSVFFIWLVFFESPAAKRA